MDQFIRHGGCDRLAVPLGDHRQHHVDRRPTPRAGEAVAVDLEQFISHFKLGELLAQRLLVLPMHRAAMLIEQSGLCQNMRTRADRSERHAIKGQSPQLGDQPAKLLLLHIKPGADHHMRHRPKISDGAIDVDAQPLEARTALPSIE